MSVSPQGRGTPLDWPQGRLREASRMRALTASGASVKTRRGRRLADRQSNLAELATRLQPVEREANIAKREDLVDMRLEILVWR